MEDFLRSAVAGETNRGCVRDHNEDNFCCLKMATGQILAVVADGVGGHSGGEIASYLCCHRMLLEWKAFLAEYGNPADEMMPDFLVSAIRKANGDIFRANFDLHKRMPMCTTVAAAIVTPQWIITAHLGDSRIYCSRNGKLWQLTCDHTLLNDMKEQGKIVPGQKLPAPNIISQALGPRAKVKPELHTFCRAPEDRIVLSSDGLTAHWQPSEIQSVVAEAQTPRQAAGNLIAGTLRRGAVDNVTVLCVMPEKTSDRQS